MKAVARAIAALAAGGFGLLCTSAVAGAQVSQTQQPIGQLASLAPGSIDGVVQDEKDVPVVFASVREAEVVANFRVANSGAIKAMKDLDAWLQTQEANATNNFAIGPEKFSEMLKATERVDVPLAQLKEIAERDQIGQSSAAQKVREAGAVQ